MGKNKVINRTSRVELLPELGHEFSHQEGVLESLASLHHTHNRGVHLGDKD